MIMEQVGMPFYGWNDCSDEERTTQCHACEAKRIKMLAMLENVF